MARRRPDLDLNIFSRDHDGLAVLGFIESPTRRTDVREMAQSSSSTRGARAGGQVWSSWRARKAADQWDLAAVSLSRLAAARQRRRRDDLSGGAGRSAGPVRTRRSPSTGPRRVADASETRRRPRRPDLSSGAVAGLCGRYSSSSPDSGRKSDTLWRRPRRRSCTGAPGRMRPRGPSLRIALVLPAMRPIRTDRSWPIRTGQTRPNRTGRLGEARPRRQALDGGETEVPRPS